MIPKKTTSDQSSTPTFQDDKERIEKEMEEEKKQIEKEIEEKKEQKELEKILEANMSSFSDAMNNTLKEIMEGNQHGSK